MFAAVNIAEPTSGLREYDKNMIMSLAVFLCRERLLVSGYFHHFWRIDKD